MRSIRQSPSARKVWIEIPLLNSTNRPYMVTFREEGVDWNKESSKNLSKSYWSPSARKVWIEISSPDALRIGYKVTFREEGVDWNLFINTWHTIYTVSPSARKVWIEMQAQIIVILCQRSPSARKVWIEITLPSKYEGANSVTFREEGVDWNLFQIQDRQQGICHLPRGRCGLKL